jgi:hypothetical protein
MWAAIKMVLISWIGAVESGYVKVKKLMWDSALAEWG